MPSAIRSQFLPYGVAVLIVLLALTFMLLLDPWLGMTQTPFVLFYGAVVLSAWYGGWKAGILATGSSALLSAYFFHTGEELTFDLPTCMRVGLFVIEGALVSGMCRALQMAKRRVEVNLSRLQASEERFRLALSSANITVSEQDRALRYQWIQTPKGLHLTEVSIGKTDDELFIAAEAEKLTALKQQALEQGVLVRDLVGLTLNGKFCYFDLTVEPLRDSYGRMQGVLCAAVDITKRVQIEQQLQDTTQQTTRILESITDAFFAVDKEWRLTYVNRQFEAMAQSSQADLIGQSLWNFSPNIVGSAFYEGYHRAIAQQIVVTIEAPAPDNTGRWFEARAYPSVDGLFVYFQDITIRKQAEAELKQTEQALRESEAKCRSVVESRMMGIGFCNLDDGTITEANDALLQILGYTQADIATGNVQWSALTPPEYASLDRKALSQIAEQGYCTPYEKEYIRKEGTRVPILMGGGHFKEDRQRGAFFVLDISERQAALQARQQAEAEIRSLNQALEQRVSELQTLLSVIPVGIAIAEDPQCHLIRANPFFQKIFNIRPDANLSVTGAGQTLVPVKRLRNGKELTVEELPMQVAATQGVEVRNAEMQIVRPDGVSFDLLGSATPLFDQRGQVRGCVAVFMDITEQKRVQAELADREEQLRLAVEGADLGMWDICLPSRHLRWSTRCKTMFGLAPDTEITYDGFLNILHPEDRELVQRSIDQAIDQRQEYDVEMRLLLENGTRWIRSMGRVYYDEHNTPLRMAGVLMDITARKQAEAEQERLLQLEQTARTEAETANRIKDEFLAVLSHELRSPLNPILGWAKLLRSRQFDDSARDRALETIERNAKLQAQLVEDLLDVSRILRGKLNLNVASVDLVTTIRAAIETVRLAADAKSIQLQTQFASESGQVLGDAGRLQQVVWNLLTNAVKFTPVGGRVQVRLEMTKDRGRRQGTEGSEGKDAVFSEQEVRQVSQPAGYAQIQVIDTGKGIAPEFLPYVFDYFRQADSSTTRVFGGLGLGLAIVRHLVEMHGGTVQAESAGEGQGATFTVLLPLKDQDNRTQTEPVHSLSVAQTDAVLRGISILAVDDEADMRDYVACVLEQAGADVVLATSAGEALAKLSRTKPHVLLSDIGMPNVDGYMLLRQIRMLLPELGGQVPAIALTAYAAEYDQKQAQAAGFQLHLPKPVEPEALIRAIASLVGRHPPA